MQFHFYVSFILLILLPTEISNVVKLYVGKITYDVKKKKIARIVLLVTLTVWYRTKRPHS